MDSKKKQLTPWRSVAAALVVALSATPAFSQAPSSYVVGALDVLTITSYDQADLSGKFTVETDGTFTYPLIGRFKAGGLTLRRLEEDLKGRLRDDGYFKNPQITVSVETYRSQKIFVVGEVRTPGSYPLSGNMVFVEVKNPGAYALQQKNTTVLQALSLAGGVVDRGSTARIRIARIVGGEKQEIRAKLNDVVQPGDTIIVPERFF